VVIHNAVATGLTSGQTVLVTGVGGTTEANGYWPVTIVNSTDFLLVGSTWSNAWTSGGIWATCYEDLVISGNRLNGCDIWVNGPAPGCAITGNKLTGGIPGSFGGILATDHNLVISDNSINMTGVGGSSSCITVAGNGSSVTGNSCIGTNAYGISVTGSSGSVTGNTCQACGLGAVLVTGNDAVVSGNSCSSSPGGISVVGNSHVVNGNKILTATTGITTNGTDNQCLGNSVRLCGEFGILAAGNYASIHGNKILDCNTTNTATVSGIFLSSCACAQVIGNHIENRTALVGQLYYGITYGTNTGLVVRDNRIVNMQTAEMLATGSSATQPRSQDLYVDTTAQSAGTDLTEDTLKTTGSTFNPGCLGLQGGLKMRASGTCSGSGGGKMAKLYLASTVMPIGGLSISSGTNNWTIEAEVWNNGTESTQTYWYRTFVGGALVGEAQGVASFLAEATTGPIAKVTMQKIVTTDVGTCNTFTVERFQ
jgi:hypothetical protein